MDEFSTLFWVTSGAGILECAIPLWVLAKTTRSIKLEDGELPPVKKLDGFAEAGLYFGFATVVLLVAILETGLPEPWCWKLLIAAVITSTIGAFISTAVIVMAENIEQLIREWKNSAHN